MINHIEKYIGTISHGSKSDSGSQYKLNIAAIPSSPNRDLKTYITLGLSKHDLNYKSRFEILFVCSLKYDENQIFPFLRWLAETIIENKKILLRGGRLFICPEALLIQQKWMHCMFPLHFISTMISRSVMANTTISFSLCLSRCINRKQNWWKKRVGMLLSSSCWIMKLATFRI